MNTSVQDYIPINAYCVTQTVLKATVLPPAPLAPCLGKQPKTLRNTDVSDYEISTYALLYDHPGLVSSVVVSGTVRVAVDGCDKV